MTKMQTPLEIVILQHPQEKSKDLATAPIVTETLARAQIKVGLSWPNLSKVLGRQADPKKWGVLFVGSQASAQKVRPLPRNLSLDGVIVLDGNWAQAKTMWWRNAWLLKLHRIVLTPTQPSLYNQIRREPRRECLSTLEAVESAMRQLGNTQDQAGAEALHENFLKFLDQKNPRNGSKAQQLPAHSSTETEKA